MKSESTVRPERFTIEYLDKFEKCTIRFNTNIQEEQRPIPGEEEETETIYVYDTYVIKTWYRKTLQSDVDYNYDVWLDFAKKQEYDEYAKTIREQRDKLLAETDKEMVLDRIKLNMPEDITMANIISGIKDFFTSLKDVMNSPMAEYRQKLRDIPQQERFSL